MDYPAPGSRLAVGDFDGDGMPDLASSNSAGDAVTVLLGDGTGAMGAAASYPAGTAPGPIVSGDLNGDGRSDLVVANTVDKAFNVLLAQPGGSFSAPVRYATGSSIKPGMAGIGDLDTDGDLDLVLGGSTIAGETQFGDGAGGFTYGGTFTLSGGGGTAILVADVTGDGNNDAVAAVTTGVDVLPGDGAGALGAATNYPTAFQPAALAVGDLNADTRLDVVTVERSANTASVLMGQAGGSLGAAIPYPTGTDPDTVAVGDFNGDGDLDVVTGQGSSNQMSVLPGDGTGVLGVPVNFPVSGNVFAVAAPDLNLDGFPDLAGSLAGGLLTVLLNTAAPQLTSVTPATGPTAGGTTIVLTGKGFAPGTAVQVGGQPATGVVVTGTSITAVTPPGHRGPVDVSVLRPDGKQAALAAGFRYVAPSPIITGVTPGFGPVTGGTGLTVTGTGFDPDATVTVGGIPATINSRVDSTAITVSTPAGAPGQVEVVVTNPDGQRAQEPGAFTYQALPDQALPESPPSSTPPSSSATPSPTADPAPQLATISVVVAGRSAQASVTPFTPGQSWRMKLQRRVKVKPAAATGSVNSTAKWKWVTVKTRTTATGSTTFKKLPSGLLRVHTAAQNGLPAASSTTFRANQNRPCPGSDCDQP